MISVIVLCDLRDFLCVLCGQDFCRRRVKLHHREEDYLRQT